MTMTKQFLIITAVASSLLAAAPAQAFQGDKPGIGKRLSHLVHGDKRHRVNTPRARYERKYGATFRYGFPNNCAERRERAFLTNNAYWKYAANSCRFSYYRYH
jgi:hypothetical protein